MGADKLYLGKIITMEPGRPTQEALTVKDGRIQFVGSAARARTLCDENTAIVDFERNCIYPGIIEGHCHPDMAGVRLKLQADMTAGQTMLEYVDIMAAFVEKNPGLNRYLGAGWCERECKPTAAMLDAICPDVPMILQSLDGHSLWMNTPAMEQRGIDQKAVEFWGTDIIRIDEQGKPTGYISEGPVIDIVSGMEYTDEQHEASYLAWQEFAFQHGLTSCLHAGINEERLQVYDRLVKAGKWKVRTYCVLLVDEHCEDYVAEVQEAKRLAELYNNEYVKIIGIKIFMDGVVEAHTAWLCEDYTDDPGNTGVKRMCDFDRVTDLFAAATEEGFLVHCHTIGDAAVKFATDCIEAAEQRTGDYTARHALCHLQIVRPEDIQRMVDLRIVPVVAPLWTPKISPFYEQQEDYLGVTRSAQAYPIKSFIDAGSPVVFHTDYPVSTQMDVPRSLYTAALRTTPELGLEGVHAPQERITREQALAALTSAAAYSVKQEDQIGKLVPGYVANMAVFDADFLDDDIEAVAQAKLLATIVDGEEVYRA